MKRAIPITDSDRRFVNSCRDLIETEADRALIDYWARQLDEANDIGQSVPAIEARRHLREWMRKRQKK